MKFFIICLFIAILLSHDLTSSLAFASPTAGSSGKEEKEPSSPVSESVDEIEAGPTDRLSTIKAAAAAPSTFHSSSSSSTQVNPSAASTATSLVLNETVTLPLGLPLKLSEFLSQSDLGALKQVTAYDPVKDLALKTNGQFVARYNLNNFNTLQKTYKKISLRNKKESIRNLLLGLLPIQEGSTVLKPFSSPHFVFPPEMFGRKQDQELELQPNSYLRSLDLTGSVVKSQDIEFIVNYFPQLEELNLRNITLKSHWIPLLIQLQNLKSLDLSGSHIPNNILEILSFFPKLENLNLSTDSWGIFQERKLIKPSQPFSHLTSLNLSGNFLGNPPSEETASIAQILESCPNLTSLNLSETSLSYQDISPLGSMPLLTSLNLRGNFIGRNADTISNFARVLKLMPALTSLNLSQNDLGDHDITPLARALESMPLLTSLNLSENPIRSGGVSALARVLKLMPALTSLNLSKNRLGSHDITPLAQVLKLMPALTSLNLSQNDLGDHDITPLAQALESMPLLTSLNLSENPVRSGGVSALAHSLKELNFTSKLTSLDLNSTKVREEGAAALVELLEFFPDLTSLDLGRNHLNRGISTIVQALTKNLKLTSLNLSANGIGDYSPGKYEYEDGAADFVRILVLLPKLTSLNLSFNHLIDNNVMSDIAQALKNRNFTSKLTSLDLSHNESRNIWDKDVTALAQILTFFPNLMSLNLGGNQFADDKAASLAQALKDLNFTSKLTSLDLSSNYLCKSTPLTLAQILKSFPNLTSLNLGRNYIGNWGFPAFAQILESLPQLTSLKLWNNYMSTSQIADLKKFIKRPCLSLKIKPDDQ